MGPVRLARVAELLIFAQAHPSWEVHDAIRTFHWSRNQADQAIQDLRLQFGDNPLVNLVCRSNGQSQPWLYRLVPNFRETRWWGINRTADALTRLRVIRATQEAVALRTHPTTPEGKIARMIVKHLRRAQREAARLVATYDGAP